MLWRWVGAGLSIWLLAAAGWATSAYADPSGVVIAVVQSAQVDGQTGKKVLQPEAPVFSGDHIITGAVGEAQVKFRDNTKLVVGPNSMMVIDAFVFSDNNSARKISINAVRGAFRFITGNSPKDAYSITTPTATIGVRGTEFDLNVDQATGTTSVATFAGVTHQCRKGPNGQKLNCIDQREACGVSVIEPQKDPRRVALKQERNAILVASFRYALFQQRLQPEFRVNVASCGQIVATGFQNNSSNNSNESPPPPPVQSGIAPGGGD